MPSIDVFRARLELVDAVAGDRQVVAPDAAAGLVGEQDVTGLAGEQIAGKHDVLTGIFGRMAGNRTHLVHDRRRGRRRAAERDGDADSGDQSRGRFPHAFNVQHWCLP